MDRDDFLEKRGPDLEKEISYPEGELIFDVRPDGVFLTRVTGSFTELTLPEDPEGIGKVTAVSKKAFLGRKTLKRISLPQSITSVGDWCFTNCLNLISISMPSCMTGEGIFNGCTSLEEIMLPGISGDMGALLAGAVRYGAPPHLTDITKIENDRYEKWDAWVKRLLAEPDDEGFTNQILCGEEDYGSCDKDAYESRRRVMKASLCILRLLHPEKLSEANSSLMSDYLYRHREGSPDGNESWVAVRDHFPDKKHFDLLSRLECIDDTNRDKMIRSLGDDRQELKSLLIKTSGSDAADRFFSAFEL